MDLKEMEKALKAPFHPDEIEWRVGSTNKEKTRGLALAYVTNRAVQNRLDEVFGIAGWKNEFSDWKGKGVLCGISCFINDNWITKWDGAEETNMEATKGGISDAMKRAGYQWGIGRYLYQLESTWVEIKPVGNSYYIPKEAIPKLPQWALPEGFTYGPQRQPQGKPELQMGGVTGVKKELPQDEVLVFQGFQRELKENDQKYLNRLTASVAGLANKYHFEAFQVKTLHDLAKLPQVCRDELAILYRKKITDAAAMIDNGEQNQEVKCSCGKKLSDAEIAFCNSKGIKVACRTCQKKAG